MKGIYKLKLFLRNTDETVDQVINGENCPNFYGLNDYCELCCSECWDKALDEDFQPENINRRID